MGTRGPGIYEAGARIPMGTPPGVRADPQGNSAPGQLAWREVECASAEDDSGRTAEGGGTADGRGAGMGTPELEALYMLAIDADIDHLLIDALRGPLYTRTCGRPLQSRSISTLLLSFGVIFEKNVSNYELPRSRRMSSTLYRCRQPIAASLVWRPLMKPSCARKLPAFTCQCQWKWPRFVSLGWRISYFIIT